MGYLSNGVIFHSVLLKNSEMIWNEIMDKIQIYIIKEKEPQLYQTPATMLLFIVCCLLNPQAYTHVVV